MQAETSATAPGVDATDFIDEVEGAREIRRQATHLLTQSHEQAQQILDNANQVAAATVAKSEERAAELLAEATKTATRLVADAEAAAAGAADKAVEEAREEYRTRATAIVDKAIEDSKLLVDNAEAQAARITSGAEEADFIFSPNPGEPAKPLRLIASSGEMSRVMLAVKSTLADEDAIPLLVFDEIDANVGGEIAQAVGCPLDVTPHKLHICDLLAARAPSRARMSLL